MAATYFGQGGAVATTTSAAPTFPASTPAGALAVAYVSSNSTTAPTTVPTGWKLLKSGTSGGHTLHAYYQTALTAGTETGSRTWSGMTGGTKGAAYIAVYQPGTAGNKLYIAGATVGLDADTASTAFSATGADAWTPTTDDRILAGAAGAPPSGSFTGSWGSQTITSANSTVSTTGRFGGLTGTNTVVYGLQDASVSAGATGAPAMTATATGANVAGVAIFLLVREAAGIAIVGEDGRVLTASASPSATFTVAPLENDLVVMFPSIIDTATIAIPSGWENPLGGTTHVITDSHAMECVIHRVTSGEAAANTVTFTATSLFTTTETGWVQSVVVRGADTTTATAGAASTFSNTNAATPHVLAGVTPTADGGLVVSSVSKDATGTYTSLPSGWRWARQDNAATNNGRATLANTTLTTSGTPVAATNITPSAGDEYASITVVLKAVPPPVTPIAASDAWTGTDDASVSQTATDSGAGTDDAAPSRALQDTDIGFLFDFDDYELAAVSLTATDAAAGTDAATVDTGGGTVPKADSDSATGYDGVIDIIAAIPATDSTAGADAATLAVAVPATDSGTATDAVTARSLAAADTAAGTDASPYVILRPISLVGLGGFPLGSGSLGADDEMEGDWALFADTGSSNVTTGNPSSSDTAAGTDDATLTVAVAATDSGAVTDVATGGAPIAVTDAATGTDAATSTVPQTATDSAAGTDTAALAVAVAGTDSGTVTDVATGGAPINVTDSWAGTDAATSTVPQTLTDTGALTDNVTLAVTRTVTDAGTVTDLATGGAPIFGTDSATGSDGTATLAVAVSGTDAGTATEQTTSTSPRAVTDAAAATDNATKGEFVSKAGSDAWTGTDAASVSIAVVSADTGAAIDTAAIPPAALSISDVFVSLDGATITVAVTVADTSTGTDLLGDLTVGTITHPSDDGWTHPQNSGRTLVSASGWTDPR